MSQYLFIYFFKYTTTGIRNFSFFANIFQLARIHIDVVNYKFFILILKMLIFIQNDFSNTIF